MIYVIENGTGRIAQRVDTLDEYAEHYVRDGHTVLVTDQVVDIASNYILDDRFVSIPEKPSEFHIWDWPTHAWLQNKTLAENSVRAKRDGLLRSVVNTINAVRWAAMVDAERVAWDTYRAELLDLTDQDGFPFSITWPVAPDKGVSQ